MELPLRIIQPETHSFDVVDCIGETIASDLKYEECEFIVKACNSFDAQESKIKDLELKLEMDHKIDKGYELYKMENREEEL